MVDEEVTEPGLWKKNGWIARVIKNPDDDGWAVEMTRDGESEPALVGPWTMGRDKRNPKPIDSVSFAVLVKGANEVRARHHQQLRAQLHRSVTVSTGEANVRVDLDIVPDDDDPHAILALFDDATSEPLRSGRVAAGFRLDAANVRRWMESGGE